MRGDEVARAAREHRAAVCGGERRFGQRQGEQLVGSNRGVGAERPVEHVEQAVLRGIPEAREAGLDADRTSLPALDVPAQPASKRDHGGVGVVPEGVHLDGFAVPRVESGAA